MTNDSLAEAERFITEDTAFSRGKGNAEMLVSVCYRDWCAEKTHTSQYGQVRTSEGHAFDQLLHWLGGDATAVYRVLALFETQRSAA